LETLRVYCLEKGIIEMAYTTNPKLPRLRAQAVEMVRKGKSVTEVARHFGYTKGAISKWCKKAPPNGTWAIPTESSRPKRHPKEVKKEVVEKIRNIRIALGGRCAEVIKKHLEDEGIKLHRITVQRVLDRIGLTKKRKWKHWHPPITRPGIVKPGDLVQVDTIHLMKEDGQRMYIYTLLDVCSRWAYALATERANAVQSVLFLRKAITKAPFSFNCIQSDNGPEFSTHFTERIRITHRHSRVSRPNDNAHLERFNRTLQEELISRLPVDTTVINKFLPAYLDYYNTKRYHLGINLKTPSQMLQKRFQAIV
jgi:transposase InsO family protein